MIISGIELYVPHTFSNTKAKKAWLNFAFSRAVNDREAAHNWYRSHPSAETHAIYISGRNHAKSILQLTKNSFINRKCQSLFNSNSSRDFWHLANNSSNNFTSSSLPPLLQPDGTIVVSSFSIAELFAQTFATNSTLNGTGRIQPVPKQGDRSNLSNYCPIALISYLSKAFESIP